MEFPAILISKGCKIQFCEISKGACSLKKQVFEGFVTFYNNIIQNWILDIILNLAIDMFVSAIFWQFFFPQNDSHSKTMKDVFISSKKLFSFSRYSNFCISIFSFFLLVSYCFRAWSMINLKFMMSSTVSIRT